MQLNIDCVLHPSILQASSVMVAFSGGIDSMVLLHLASLAKKKGYIQKLSALHVNHQLSPFAEEWALFCQNICTNLNIPYHLKKMNRSKEKGKSLELSAREKRYALFIDSLPNNAVLLLGHHQTDQAETVLFRVLRGSYVYGLQAIPQCRTLGKGRLFRPLLTVNRCDILEYAKRHGLSWIDDESNDHQNHDRNFLRHSIMPILKKRWPQVEKKIAQLADHCVSSQKILDEKAVQYLEKIEHVIDIPYLGKKTVLHAPSLCEFSLEDQQNVLIYWFRKNHYAFPRSAIFKRLIDEIIVSKTSNAYLFLDKTLKVRRYQEWLLFDPDPIRCSFLSQKVILETSGVVWISDYQIVYEKSDQKNNLVCPLQEIQIVSRCNIKKMEPFSLPGRQGRKTLKKWLNEFNIPFWLRDSLPILMYGEFFVAIPQLFVNRQFLAQPKEMGWHFSCDRITENHDVFSTVEEKM